MLPKLLDLLFGLYVRIVPKSWFRDIVINDELYLRRLYLTPKSWSTKVFIHHMRVNDAGAYLHDHPWNFSSLVLLGSYTESIPQYAKQPGTALRLYREHGWLKFHRYKATDSHQVQLPEGKHAVTLCIAGPAKRVWGFHVGKGWEDWRTHLGLPEEEFPTPPEDIVRPKLPSAAWTMH